MYAYIVDTRAHFIASSTTLLLSRVTMVCCIPWHAAQVKLFHWFDPYYRFPNYAFVMENFLWNKYSCYLQKTSRSRSDISDRFRHPRGVSSVFKTGYKPIDDHCRPSQFADDTGNMIDDFRQLKLKEYHDIMNLCEKRGVMLSQKLLDRGKIHGYKKQVLLFYLGN